jgi:hypothetical protein
MTKQNREFECRLFFHNYTKLEQSDRSVITTKTPPCWSACDSAHVTFALSIQVESTLCSMPNKYMDRRPRREKAA